MSRGKLDGNDEATHELRYDHTTHGANVKTGKEYTKTKTIVVRGIDNDDDTFTGLSCDDPAGGTGEFRIADDGTVFTEPDGHDEYEIGVNARITRVDDADATRDGKCAVGDTFESGSHTVEVVEAPATVPVQEPETDEDEYLGDDEVHMFEVHHGLADALDAELGDESDEEADNYYVSEIGNATRHCPACGYEGTNFHPRRRRPTYHAELRRLCPDEDCARELHEGPAGECDICEDNDVRCDGGVAAATPAITRVEDDEDDEEEVEEETAERRERSDFSTSDNAVFAAVENGNTTAKAVHNDVDFSLGQVRGCLKNLTEWGYLTRARNGRSYQYELN